MTRRPPALVGLLLAAAVLACEGREYARDADTGAAAPATKIDMSATQNVGDSTTGIAQPSGKPGSTGDTLRSRGEPAGPPGQQPPTRRP